MDETRSPKGEKTFKQDGGIAEFITKLIAERGKGLVPPASPAFYKSHENGVRLEMALAWTEATDETTMRGSVLPGKRPKAPPVFLMWVSITHSPISWMSWLNGSFRMTSHLVR